MRKNYSIISETGTLPIAIISHKAPGRVRDWDYDETYERTIPLSIKLIDMMIPNHGIVIDEAAIFGLSLALLADDLTDQPYGMLIVESDMIDFLHEHYGELLTAGMTS